MTIAPLKSSGVALFIFWRQSQSVAPAGSGTHRNPPASVSWVLTYRCESLYPVYTFYDVTIIGDGKMAKNKTTKQRPPNHTDPPLSFEEGKTEPCKLLTASTLQFWMLTTILKPGLIHSTEHFTRGDILSVTMIKYSRTKRWNSLQGQKG